MTEAIIRFKDTVSQAEAEAFIQNIRGIEFIESSLERRTTDPEVRLAPRFYRIDISEFPIQPNEPANRNPFRRFLREFGNQPEIEYIDENIRANLAEDSATEIEVPNDRLFSAQWALENIGQRGPAAQPPDRQTIPGLIDADIEALEAWEIATGDDVVIAVIDSGIAFRHRDLRNNIWVNPNESLNGIDDDNNGLVDDIRGWDFINERDERREENEDIPDNSQALEDNNPLDNLGHGTAIAGIIASTGNNNFGTIGVSYDAQLIPLRAISGRSSLFDIIQAIEYAIEAGADLINASWGGTSNSRAFTEVIQDAPLIITAAGNEGRRITTDTTLFPVNSRADNVISVAATDRADNFFANSNFGRRTIDLAAPGVDIITTRTPTEFTSRTGTSFAAPHVTGAAALVIQRLREIEPSFDSRPLAERNQIIKNIILNQTTPIASLTNKTITGGRLRLDLATISEADLQLQRIRLDGELRTDTLIGWVEDEILFGRGGNDRLSGKNGDDILVGGVGEDTLVGGEGRDRFRLAIADHKTDQIQDFNSNFDSLDIFFPDQINETWLNSNGSLKSKFLVFDQDNAPQGFNHFVYEQRTGTLSFIDIEKNSEDAIALLSNKAQVSSSNIFLR